MYSSVILWGIIFAAICGAVAYRQKRKVIWGIVFGFLGGLLSLIVYLIIGKKEDTTQV